MGSDNDNGSTIKTCGLTELLIFLAAIVSGTACSICSKTMMGLKGVGITNEEEMFQKPIFQTFGMFVGMTFALLMHFVVLYFRIPFPGYEQKSTTTNRKEETRLKQGNQEGSISAGYGAIEVNETDPLVSTGSSASGNDDGGGGLPVWMYFFLAIPSVFDLGATALCMMGLQYIDVSIYQLLRGSGIIFVALMKQYFLGDKLFTFQWVGIFWNVISVILVGGTAIMSESTGPDQKDDDSKAMVGVLFVMAGAIVQAMQFVFEEKVMTMDIPAPPLLLIGMEGLWGSILCLFVVYPLVYYLPGDDHGSYEDPFNTWEMIMNSRTIQSAFLVYFFAIFLYNFFAVMVTFKLNSVWHAILDNFRPITVWITDLLIFYVFARGGDFGEDWSKYSWIQVGGMMVLLYGTAVYNAPNPGSVLLDGSWYALGLDFSTEYAKVETETEESALDEAWQQKMISFKGRTDSSFYGERSPFISQQSRSGKKYSA